MATAYVMCLGADAGDYFDMTEALFCEGDYDSEWFWGYSDGCRWSGAAYNSESLRQDLIERQLTVRLAAKPNISGGKIKGFQLPMIAQNPVIEATDSTTATTTSLVAGGGGGLAFPFTFDIDFTWDSSGGTATIVNPADLDTYPVVKIYGPITQPEIRNSTNGLRFALTNTIALGDYVEVDMRNQTVTLNGSTPLLGSMDVLVSEWWPLEPGSNSVLLVGAVPDGAYATIEYRPVFVS
jgi:hypothetical protein